MEHFAVFSLYVYREKNLQSCLGGSWRLCFSFPYLAEKEKTEMQEPISEAASEKRKRGRPAIDVSMTSYLDVSHRSHVNAVYMYEGISIISEAASEIPDHDLLWVSDDSTQSARGKQGILEQVGRMWKQDGYGFDSCVTIANLAIASLKNGHTSREIENAIRKIRTTTNQETKNPDDKIFAQRANQAVLDLRLMAIVSEYR